MSATKHEAQLKISATYLGYGIDDEGREYEGYEVNGEYRYFYTSDGSELTEC